MKLRIRELRHDLGLTLEQLSAKAGISRSYLSEMEVGSKTINARRLVQVAQALGVTPEALIERSAVPVVIAGRVGAGATVPVLDLSDNGGLGYVACPPQLAAEEIIAVEVSGNSMMPMYEPRSILFFRRSKSIPVPPDAVGRVCVIEDKKGNAWVKLLKKGSKADLWNLVSLNPTSDSVWDAEIKWAARVRLALPPDLVDHL